ncbi:MAG: hypothetical protein AAF039_03475 [Bacteroidota bacterium]
MRKANTVLSKLLMAAITLPLPFLLLACGSDDDSNSGGCENVACTLIYISLSVTIVDGTDAPVALDSYTVIDTQNNRNLPPDFSADSFENMQATGRYVFFSDFWRDDYRNESTVLRFTGFLNGTEVIMTELEVNADCCHVSLVSGDVDLIVD